MNPLERRLIARETDVFVNIRRQYWSGHIPKNLFIELSQEINVDNFRIIRAIEAKRRGTGQG